MRAARGGLTGVARQITGCRQERPSPRLEEDGRVIHLHLRTDDPEALKVALDKLPVAAAEQLPTMISTNRRTIGCLRAEIKVRRHAGAGWSCEPPGA